MKFSTLAGLVLVLLSIRPASIFAQCTVRFDRCPKDTVIVDCDFSGTEIFHYQPIIANHNGLCNSIQVVHSTGPQPGSTVPVGIYSVQFSVFGFDANQQIVSTAACSFSVSIIKDVQAPVLTNCPPNMVIFGTDDGTGNCTSTAYWTPPTSSDFCGATSNAVSGGSCGSPFSNGTTTVTYTNTDASNNSTTCSFTVTVICVSESSEPGKYPNAFRIFPNPNPGAFTVELSQPAAAGIRFRVTDVAGRLVMEQSAETGSAQQTVRCEALPSGLYFLQAVAEGRVLAAERFVKE
ncbi:MAG: HYR domain-containing protein [Saprospiraceae bacterium]